ncbi:MAG: hypothetical protein WCE38_06580 [Burkholderiales bacterium]
METFPESLPALVALALVLAGWSAIRQFSPRLDVWGDGKELAFGVGMVASVLATFLAALAIRRLADGFVGVSARGALSAPATAGARGEDGNGV